MLMQPSEARISSVSSAGLPSFDEAVDEMIEAELAEGWLARCIDADRYLALNDRFVQAVAAEMRSIGEGPVLEVCAGRGELAAALRSAGVDVIATDVSPPPGSSEAVHPLSAAEALRRYRPSVVIGSFVPVDAGVDRLVLTNPDVSHYFVVNSRVAGQFGSDALWNSESVSARLLSDATRWMISRHDVYIDNQVRILTHGEVWLYTLAIARNASATPCD